MNMNLNMNTNKPAELFAEYPDILTFEDLQEMLSLSRNTVYNLLRKNIIKNKKIGRLYRIQKRCVIDFINSEEEGA